MGWQIRKTKRFGSLRLTLGRRGVSASVGFGPFRIGRGADGKWRQTVRLPGGVYRTDAIRRSEAPDQPTRPDGRADG